MSCGNLISATIVAWVCFGKTVAAAAAAIYSMQSISLYEMLSVGECAENVSAVGATAAVTLYK